MNFLSGPDRKNRRFVVFQTFLKPQRCTGMIKLFVHDPVKRLQERRSRLLEQAMKSRQSGNISLYAEKMVEADILEKKIDILQSAGSAKAA